METVKFTIEIPEDQAALFLEALALKFGGYKPTLPVADERGRVTQVANPETINEFVRRKQIEEWQALIMANEMRKATPALIQSLPAVAIR